jgi:hypothetical protein
MKLRLRQFVHHAILITSTQTEFLPMTLMLKNEGAVSLSEKFRTVEFLYRRADGKLVVRFHNGLEVGMSEACFSTLPVEG